jgi:hypothetical protein
MSSLAQLFVVVKQILLLLLAQKVVEFEKSAEKPADRAIVEVELRSILMQAGDRTLVLLV